jgi:hypothetical protein
MRRAIELTGPIEPHVPEPAGLQWHWEPNFELTLTPQLPSTIYIQPPTYVLPPVEWPQWAQQQVTTFPSTDDFTFSTTVTSTPIFGGVIYAGGS